MTYVMNVGKKKGRETMVSSIIKRLKEVWSNPRDIEEAEWYILFGLFVIVWMWMIIWV